VSDSAANMLLSARTVSTSLRTSELENIVFEYLEVCAEAEQVISDETEEVTGTDGGD
jgi:hypothetical protein